MMWPEIERARDENRKELVLSASKLSEPHDAGLDPTIYSLKALNYLEINGIPVGTLSEDLVNLNNLTSLILKRISVNAIPISIGKLVKLKILDVSFNDISRFPDNITKLSNLESLLAGSNKLEDLPNDFNKLGRLHILDLSHNKLSSLDKVCRKEFVHLHSVNVCGNDLKEIPADISHLSALKTIDLSENGIELVPGDIAQCGKLKEIELKGNKLKDNRLTKLINQGKYKAILDYIRKSCPVSAAISGGCGDQSGGGGKGKKKKGGKGGKKDDNDEDSVEMIRDLVEVLHFNQQTPTVTIDDSVLDIRPHIVCCVIKGIDLSKQDMFKKFINLQTKLHDEVCEKRTVATIATHDLANIKGDISYEARSPQAIQVQPLFKPTTVSAEDLVAKLRKEADDYRKEHKRNTFSGIHKYLELLDNVPKYPCLVDTGNNNNVISFPPITNSDTTKVCGSSKDLLVEVTSNISIPVAKNVMDTLLYKLMKIQICGIKSSLSDNGAAQKVNDVVEADAEHAPGYLNVQQVKILDAIGQMKLVYPSRTDLANFSGAKITRDY